MKSMAYKIGYRKEDGSTGGGMTTRRENGKAEKNVLIAEFNQNKSNANRVTHRVFIRYVVFIVAAFDWLSKSTILFKLYVRPLKTNIARKME